MTEKEIQILLNSGYSPYSDAAVALAAGGDAGAIVTDAMHDYISRTQEAKPATRGTIKAASTGRCRDCGSYGPRDRTGNGLNCGCALE